MAGRPACKRSVKASRESGRVRVAGSARTHRNGGLWGLGLLAGRDESARRSTLAAVGCPDVAPDEAVHRADPGPIDHQRRVLRHHCDDRTSCCRAGRATVPRTAGAAHDDDLPDPRAGWPSLALGACSRRVGWGGADSGGARVIGVGRSTAAGPVRPGWPAAPDRDWSGWPARGQASWAVGRPPAGRWGRHEGRAGPDTTMAGFGVGGRVSAVAGAVGAPRPGRARSASGTAPCTNRPSARLTWATLR